MYQTLLKIARNCNSRTKDSKEDLNLSALFHILPKSTSRYFLDLWEKVGRQSFFRAVLFIRILAAAAEQNTKVARIHWHWLWCKHSKDLKQDTKQMSKSKNSFQKATRNSWKKIFHNNYTLSVEIEDFSSDKTLNLFSF